MSRNPERIDLILGEIRRIWNRNPDLRLGQLLENSTDLTTVTHYMYYVEDDVLLAGLLNYGKEGN